MSDDDETPPLGPRSSTKRRVQTQTDRDVEGFAARKERERSVPVEVHEDITGQYEGEERKMYRGQRPPEERLERLETKADTLEAENKTTREDIAQINVNIGEIRGEMKLLPRLITALEDAAKSNRDRETIKLTAEVGIGTARAMEPIEKAKAARGWITTAIATCSTLALGVLAIMKAKGC